MGKPWLKLWTETLHDRKLRRIPPEQRWCWIGLLMIAAEGQDTGRLEVTPGEPLTDDDFLDALAVTPETWTAARQYFLSLGMLQLDGATLVLTNYQKRQESKDPTAAERNRRLRARRAEERQRAIREQNQAAVTPVTVTPVTRNSRNGVTQMLRVEEEAEEEYSNSSSAARPPIFVLYEQNIGTLNPGITELLKDAEQVYPPHWIPAAFTVAVRENKRSWSYTEGCLRKWQTGEYPAPILNPDGTVTIPERPKTNGKGKEVQRGATARRTSGLSVRPPTNDRFGPDGKLITS